ncbi:Hpt domain-containing protein [Geminocystis sp. NIES-3709]|uniref:Hpt domain-containing protein n=1 Tax=Geminocystis sp. NIES-3709 TaxID=1617448 RepID=UPI0005FCDABE|nr:Hpt domain-containing protein [Geminocystis sp. NIES-3709]BAQ65296.1 signal transduction histidine kinase CheA [Geminocystis sp. NIES-3709]
MNPLNQAYQLFIDEVPELLQGIENGLLNLREDKSTSTVHGMMRAAHSIKGGSASVGLKGIRDIAHKLEDYIKALYNEDLVIDTELEDLFLEGYDCLAIPLREQLETGNFDRQQAQNRANQTWEKLELKLGNALKQVENYLPSSEDLGIDIIASIFEVDVAQEIRRLKGVIASPETFNPLQELQESLDILTGFSELVNLSGFSLLISITQQALQKHPDKAVTIATLLVQDLDKSRDVVLLGDRTEGGNPCSALLTLAEDTSAQVEINVIEQLTQNYQVTFNINDPSYQFFIAEVPDLLHNLESGLLTVREDKSISKVNDMMRSAHSIKGGAASVGLEGIKNISHKLEDYLKALFDETVVVDDELENYLLEGFDCLKNALSEQIETGNYQPEWEQNALIVWDKLGQKLGHIQVNDYLPSSADLGIDLVQSLFEVDVLQTIEQLKESLNNLPIIELQNEVTLQLEMLTGFSEMTSLIGLKNIADTVSLAINNYPHRIQQITSYLINDLTEARQQVLSGDREQGGQPSTILQQLAGLLEINEGKDSTLDFSEIAQENDSQNTIDVHTHDSENFNFSMDTPSENELKMAENIDFTDLIEENDTFNLNSENLEFADLVNENDDFSQEENIPEFGDLVSENDDFTQEENIPEFGDLVSENDDFTQEENIPEFGDLVNENDDFSQEENISEFGDLVSENDDFSQEENIPEFGDLVSEIEDSYSEQSIEFGDLISEDNNFNQEEDYTTSIDSNDLDFLVDNFSIEDESNNQQQELQAQAYVFFIDEAVDLISLIDNGLENALETRDINEVNEVARAAHSLKGGARSAGLEDLGNIALRVEKSLKALFNENIPLDEDTKSYIREIYQLLRQPLTARLEEQTYDEKLALESANAMWVEFEGKYGEEIAKSEEYLPSSSDLGIDIATSIFEVDVVEGIDSLKEALSQGDEAQMQDLVSMQIEIFSGFGEMLALPGFVAICQTAAKALERNASEIGTITKAFIDNLEIAQNLVMEGDRESGGEPSTELLSLAGEIVTENVPQITFTEHIEAPIDTNDQSYSFFVEEAPELLEIIENGLLTLRDDRSTAKIHEIMRAAHSLKGGSASVGLEAIKMISHQLEDVFKVLYDPTIELDTELEGWLLEGFDCLRSALTQQIETGSYNPQEALATANEVWAKMNTRLGTALSRVDDYIPSSSDLGVDIVQSMFEVDVQEELQRLKNVLKNPTSQPLAGELRATLEVFSGFGEMLVLPGFAEIAKLGLIAIEKNPQNALNIIQIIIRDADLARDLVLKGDRVTGGTPSEELRRFAENDIPYEDGEVFLLDVKEDTESASSLNDVFEEIAFSTQQPFTITPEDRQTQANNPPLDDAFNVNLNEEQINAIHQAIQDDDNNDSIPSIEEIFASEFSEEEIELLAKASELALEEDKNTTIPSLSEVFSNIDMSVINEIEENSVLPSLSEVFSNVDMSVIDEMEEENIVLPSLSEVFSNVDMSMINGLQGEAELTPSLESVFESESANESANVESFLSHENVEEETESPSLESVFESESANVESFLSHENVEEETESPSLESIFESESANVESFLSSENVEEETESPSLESVFEAESVPPSEDRQEVSSSLENLDAVIKSIGDVYQKLPGLKSQEEIKSSVNKKFKKIQKNSIEEKTPTPTSTTTSAKTNLTVRVDLERLERMNNLIGELSINRNGLSLQNDKLQTSVRELLERFGRFQVMANNLRDLSDKMLTSPDKFGGIGIGGKSKRQNTSNLPFNFSEDGEFNLSSAFDSLEMDSYDNMYYVVQGLIEQMIQLEEAVDDIALFAGQSGQTVENQRQMLNRMRDELMWARMLPLGEVLNRFPRVLRDLSVKYNKKVNLKLNGTSVLVDKAALEKLYDPLVHLIRNGFDHGIETPEVRKQRGKPETGIIEVKAYHQGNQTIIQIKDDGGGLNLNKIGQKAIERQMLTPEELAVTTKDNLLDLIFEPGFSTAAEVTEISGRGVGLDIVRSQLRSLKGTISVESEPGQGTTFILRLPLTLTIDKLLVLSANSHFYALPSDNIEEIIVPEEHQLKTSGNKRFLYYENKVVPIYPLSDLLEYRCYVAENPSISQALEVLPTPEDWANPLLLMSLGQELFAIEVEDLVSEQELVIKPFGNALTAPSYSYGCTILGDGTLIPVINTAILLATFLETMNPVVNIHRKGVTSSSYNKSSAPPINPLQVATVLVVDDSAAMRRTLALSLEKAGYRVIQAKDGKDALEQLQQSSKVSLIICDIEMPNMNGFEFLGQRRRYPELNKIPVAMLTSRSNDKHRKLATHLGANAYFTKPYIEQKFLQSIKSLVEQKSPVMA